MRDRLIDPKEYAAAMRETAVRDENGIIKVSPVLWEQIASLIDRAIIPPCEVGDTVYYISFGKVYKGKCHAITLKPTMQIHLYDYDGDNASYSDEAVFLSREDAEKALSRKESNND
jgi:hypothetical protein